MFDTAELTIRGNAVADPRVDGPSDNPERVTFRVVSNRRQRDPETGEWKQIGEFGMNVVCWRKLARGVAQAIRRGDPVLVIGRLTEHKFTGADGEQHWRTELTADYVGHDLSYGYAGRFDRFTQIDRSSAGDGADANGGEIVVDDAASMASAPADDEVTDPFADSLAVAAAF